MNYEYGQRHVVTCSSDSRGVSMICRDAVTGDYDMGRNRI